MLDRGLTHQHDQSTRRVAKRAARRTGVALRTGPDLLLHGVVNGFEILGPQQLNDFARTEVVIMCGRACCRADTAVQAAVELVIEAQICLDVLEDLLELLAFNGRRIRYRVANVFLDSGR